MKDHKVIGTALSIVGGAILVASMVLTIKSTLFLQNTRYAQGVVEDVVAYETFDSRGKTHRTYIPIIEWASHDQKIHSFKSQTGYGEDVYVAGDIVEVIYKDDDHEKVRLNDFMANWGDATIAFIIGIVFLGVGVYFIRYYHDGE